jgi:hypothetical protein
MKARTVSGSLEPKTPGEISKSIEPLSKDFEKTLPGFKEAKSMFMDFSVIAFKRDPEYGYEHVYLLLIVFKKSKTYGLCIYDTQRKQFIEEPADLEDYDTTYEDVTNKYSFKFLTNF